MKLLLDENLSFKLIAMLVQEFPESVHVRDIGLRGRPDREIWSHARDSGFAIVSKDTDFRDRSYVEGFPPKVIWLDVGNAGTSTIADLLRRERQTIGRFELSEEESLLVLVARRRTA